MELTINQPLNTLQLDLLRLFSRDIPDEDLLAIKKIFVQYFAQKSMDLADKVWENNQWSEKDEEQFLNGHERTPYKKKKA
jgi:hypothetical protein